MKIEMVNPCEVFWREIEDPLITQGSIALTYAFIMRQEPDTDWRKINSAITRRWKGKTALGRVKEMAWKYIGSPMSEIERRKQS